MELTLTQRAAVAAQEHGIPIALAVSCLAYKYASVEAVARQFHAARYSGAKVRAMNARNGVGNPRKREAV